MLLGLLASLALPAVGLGAGAPGEPAPRSALKRAQAALDPHPGARLGESRDVTLAMRELALALPRLEGGERRAAVRILARPTDNPDAGGDAYKVAEATPFCSANFCVHYVASTDDAPDLADLAPVNGVPDYVEAVSAAAETSFAVENGALGWPAPKSDGALGGGAGLTDIYLSNVGGDGIYGYTVPDGPPAPRCKIKCQSYLVLDNDYATDEFIGLDPGVALRVTMAHEYNHVLQFGIDAIQDGWLFESTAVWAEEKVFPADNDYLTYLPIFAATPGIPITRFSGAHGLKVYGLAVFQHWLDTGPGNFGPGAVLGSWLGSRKTRIKHFAIASTDRAIRTRSASSFAAEFAQFAAASAEWRSGGGFPDARRYPDVSRKGGLRPGARPTRIVLDHTAYRLLRIPRTARPRLRLRVRTREEVDFGIALVGRDNRTGTVTRRVELPRGRRASVTLGSPGRFERLTAVVVNADGRTRGFVGDDWAYTRDNVKFKLTLTG